MVLSANFYPHKGESLSSTPGDPGQDLSFNALIPRHLRRWQSERPTGDTYLGQNSLTEYTPAPSHRNTGFTASHLLSGDSHCMRVPPSSRVEYGRMLRPVMLLKQLSNVSYPCNSNRFLSPATELRQSWLLTQNVPSIVLVAACLPLTMHMTPVVVLDEPCQQHLCTSPASTQPMLTVAHHRWLL